VLQPLYEGAKKHAFPAARARAGARACMHVIQCINYKIPSQIRRHAHLLLRREIPHGWHAGFFLKLGHSAQPPVALAQCPNLRKGSLGSPCHP
jgi:hypothetical protein